MLCYFMLGRYDPVASVLINIPLARILAHLIGVTGIFFAVAISLLCTFWIVVVPT